MWGQQGKNLSSFRERLAATTKSHPLCVADCLRRVRFVEEAHLARIVKSAFDPDLLNRSIHAHCWPDAAEQLVGALSNKWRWFGSCSSFSRSEVMSDLDKAHAGLFEACTALQEALQQQRSSEVCLSYQDQHYSRAMFLIAGVSGAILCSFRRDSLSLLKWSTN